MRKSLGPISEATEIWICVNNKRTKKFPDILHSNAPLPLTSPRIRKALRQSSCETPISQPNGYGTDSPVVTLNFRSGHLGKSSVGL